MRCALSLAVALAVATAVTAAEIGEVRTRARIEQAMTSSGATTHAEAIARHGRRQDTGALIATLERVDADAGLDPTARTVLLQQAIVALAATPPAPAAIPVLERHVAAPRIVRAWHEDEGHRVAIDAYDTGAAARYTLREWRRSEASMETLAALAHGTWRAAQATDGSARAFTIAPLTHLANARNELIAGLESAPDVDRSAIIAARRLRDRELARYAIERGRAEVVVHALAGLADAFPAQDAFMLMARASERADLGTTGVAQVGRFSTAVPEARDWLTERLGDARLGAAAAHALSQDTGAIAVLEARLAHPHALVRNRAALALYLNGSPAARDALARALNNPGLPDGLRRNITTWLR